MSSVILDPGIKDGLLEDAQDFLDSETWYAECGIPFRRGKPPDALDQSLRMRFSLHGVGVLQGISFMVHQGPARHPSSMRSPER